MCVQYLCSVVCDRLIRDTAPGPPRGRRARGGSGPRGGRDKKNIKIKKTRAGFECCCWLLPGEPAAKRNCDRWRWWYNALKAALYARFAHRNTRSPQAQSKVSAQAVRLHKSAL